MAYFVKPAHRSAAVTAPIPRDESLPRVCVIGAGSSGITAVKSLHLAGIPFDCFEAGIAIGGNWVLDNPNGQSACYETLEINTSCPRMAFSDFPMPADYPPYARHDQVHAYFEAYAAHFGFREAITFDTTVTEVTPAARGRWRVRTRGPAGERTQEYDAVLVANGHHWDPRWPEPYPGTFTGEQIHAHDYRSGDQLEGRDVVVVGAGNSAMDIAVEGARRARSVTLSIRRGQWVMRKFLFGRASDQIALPGWMPWWVTRLRLRFGAVASGGLRRYGLPRPPHAPGQSHPVQSERIRAVIAAGRVQVRPGIERFDGDQVLFTDGSRVRADLVVWATGYRVSFPFLDPALVNPADNELPLWKRVVHPDLPGLFFIGLLQPVGAVMPLAEAQAAWVTEMLTGRYAAPADPEIRTQMVRDHERNKRRFYASPRHTMEVDFDHYLWDLSLERRAGRKRADAARDDRRAPDSAGLALADERSGARA
ncbi:MAG: NAD(P)-binding domain-containing protein [Actinobacteria bacterium]|nr:NAD(P)-binding domain-containing protein [Actinomycetota bacterium]